MVTYSNAKLTFGFDDLLQLQQFSDSIISAITDALFMFNNFHLCSAEVLPFLLLSMCHYPNKYSSSCPI